MRQQLVFLARAANRTTLYVLSESTDSVPLCKLEPLDFKPSGNWHLLSCGWRVIAKECWPTPPALKPERRWSGWQGSGSWYDGVDQL